MELSPRTDPMKVFHGPLEVHRLRVDINIKRLPANESGGDGSTLKKSVACPKPDTNKSPDFAALVNNLRKSYTTLPETGLYIVPTPIGNAEDITLRALKILDSVDIIACEDTRHTGRLLSRYGIPTRRVAYHDYSGGKARRKLLKLLAGGASIALVSDAGTPLISDPGYKLVLEALEENVPIVARTIGSNHRLNILWVTTRQVLFRRLFTKRGRQSTAGLKGTSNPLCNYSPLGISQKAPAHSQRPPYSLRQPPSCVSPRINKVA